MKTLLFLIGSLAWAQGNVPAIGYTVGGAGSVASPTDSPGTGTYTTSQAVTLSDSTSGSTICYTTNGTSPAATTPGTCSTGSTYSSPFTLSATATVKALGTKAALTNSSVATLGVYTIQAATPTTSPAAGTYSSTQTVTLSSTTGSAVICYTTDGTTTPAATTPGTCSTGTTYSGTISVAATTTIKALATKSGLTNSGVLTAAYTISGGATISRVQQVTAGPNTSNPPGVTCTLSATGAGNILVVTASNANESFDIATPVAAGVTFPGTPTVHLANATSNTLNAWVAYNIPSGVTSVAVTGASGFTSMGAVCAEYHSTGGAWTSDPVVATQTAYTGFSAPGTWDSGAASASANGSFLIGVASDGGGGATASFTAGSGWTAVQTMNTTTPICFMEEQLNVTSGSYHATGSFTSGGNMKVQSAIIVLGPA